MDNNGLEVVKSNRMKVKNNEELQKIDINEMPQKTNSKIGNAIVDNFELILNLASDIIEIKKMNVQSQAILDKMKEDRKKILAEAEAYALKKNAETNSIVSKMEMIRLMMKDFYENNNSNLTGEEFSNVITTIISQMGDID